MIKVRCPICNQLMWGASTGDWPQFPFCSPRCRLIDLGRWLSDEYRLKPDTTEEGTEDPQNSEEIP